MMVKIQWNYNKSMYLPMELALMIKLDFTWIFFSTVDIPLAMTVVLFVHFHMAVVSTFAGFEHSWLALYQIVGNTYQDFSWESKQVLFTNSFWKLIAHHFYLIDNCCEFTSCLLSVVFLTCILDIFTCCFFILQNWDLKNSASHYGPQVRENFPRAGRI